MKKYVKILCSAATICFLPLCLFHISTVIIGIQNALVLCARTIIPSLFIFLILSDCIATLLLSNREIPPKWTVFLLGNLCGFPAGAVACARYTEAETWETKNLSYLLAFSNNASPAFLLGAIGNALFSDARIGILLFISQTTVSFIGTVLTPVTVKVGIPRCNTDFSFFGVLEKTIHSILRICALICLFSAILAICRVYVSPLWYSILASVLEIGNGTFAASTLPIPYAIALCGFACGWSGICVHLQIFSLLKSMKVNKIHFVFCKLLQGICTAILSFGGYKLLLLLNF